MNKLSSIHARKTSQSTKNKPYSIHYNTRYCVIFVRIQCNILAFVSFWLMQLAISLQVYSGRHKNLQTLAARVNRVQNPLEVLRGNILAAVHIQLYKRPVIGKLISVKDDSTFNIEYWKGNGWRKKWKPWKQQIEKIGLITYQMGVHCLLISNWTRKINSRTKFKNTSERHIRIWKEIS